MNPMKQVGKMQVRISSPILSGLIFSLVIMLVGVLVVSLLLTLTGIGEESLPMFVYIIHGAALLIGGFITGRKRGTKGWYYGGLLGILYWLLIMLVGFLSMNAAFGMDVLITAGVCFVTGAIGGILGVNTNSSK